MKKFKVIISEDAREDLRKIKTYIGENFSKRDALVVISRIRNKIYKLDIFPKRTESIGKSLDGEKLYSTISGKYRVIYFIDDEKVVVVRVLHVGQNRDLELK